MNRKIPDILPRSVLILLAESLPQLSNYWWKELVLDKLTYQQQGFVKSSHLASLDQLDLAALLRILDQNWFEISRLLDLPSAARNWIKETQSIRNRWAHAPASGLDDHDIFRDLDTIERLAQVLGASDSELASLRKDKTALLAAMAGHEKPRVPAAVATQSGVFKPGDMVCLKAKRTVTGAIIVHLPSDPEDRYQVFHDGGHHLLRIATRSRRPHPSPR
jgi:ATP-dependent helicase HepA